MRPGKANNIEEVGFEAGFQKYIYSHKDQEFHKLAYQIEVAAPTTKRILYSNVMPHEAL